MDKVVEDFFSFQSSIPAMPEEVRDELRKRLIDSIFVAYGARNSRPVEIERSALLPSSGKLNSTLYFTSTKAESSIAAMINGTMTRYLDYNDTYLSLEALHPSDNFPPLVSVAESLGLGGKEVINAGGFAYSVLCALSDACSIRDRGWDHVTYISVSSAAGLGMLAGLDADRFESCIALGINNNISMRQTRAGELSMWKGATAANASRNAVFALELAMDGFTGPQPIFTGEMGFFKQVSGDLQLKLDYGRILRTMIKNYPVEYHAMSPVEAACEIRDEVKGPIDEITVDTYTIADTIIIKDPEKKHPRTRETADHSMPYLIAYSLIYGPPTPESYTSEHFSDPRILDLIGRMRFNVLPHYDEMYHEHSPVRIQVKSNGEIIEREILDPKGHFKKPFSWEDLLNKGKKLMEEDSASYLIEVGKSMESRSMTELQEVLANVNP